jgi:hypothetical protein
VRESKEILDEVNRVLAIYKEKQDLAAKNGYLPWASYSDEIYDLTQVKDFILGTRNSIIEE